MSLGEFDASGRKRPLPIPGAEFSLDVDQVITAIGQKPVLSFFKNGEPDVQVSKRGLIQITEKTRTRAGEAMIFAGGDVVTGPGMVIWAIAAGRAAAGEIDDAIRQRKGEAPYAPPPEEDLDVPQTMDEEVNETPRAHMPELSAAERVADFREVELGFSKEVALAEACRCLQVRRQGSPGSAPSANCGIEDKLPERAYIRP